MPSLSILFGFLVGLYQGLTGGGGTLFAVPLLVWGGSVSLAAMTRPEAIPYPRRHSSGGELVKGYETPD